MDRARFDEYIRRFNEADPTAFDEFLSPDMKMLNGALEFQGIEGMRDHYENKIWPYFVESLEVLQFVSSETVLAIQMWANFRAKKEADTLFGHVLPGEQFDYRGLILYEIADGKFTSITVAYNSFTNTKVNGDVIDIGMPH
ncbi:MAG: nuclear transport factor 2 family protein [Desulfobacteraceae bacterium]